jgi:hypothetical protein
MAGRSDASLFWLHWRLPNGRSGKLGPFPQAVAALAAAELGERVKSIIVALSRIH